MTRPAANPRRDAGTSVAARLDADPRAVRAEADGVQFYRLSGFLDDATCDRLIALIDAGRRPSTVMSGRDKNGFRTSESCDLDRWSPDVRPVDERIADALGLPHARGETMQGQRYAPGQHFRAHHDYFDTRNAYWEREQHNGGQRTWTAMIYLNAVGPDGEGGGATWFPNAGVRVKPARGLMLAWNNMDAEGEPNERTIHEGMPVADGVKYIVTKWFREGDWLKH